MAADTATPEETAKKARAILAKALWRNETRDQDFADPAARNAAYKDVRKDYMTKARVLATQMEKQGLMLVFSDNS